MPTNRSKQADFDHFRNIVLLLTMIHYLQYFMNVPMEDLEEWPKCCINDKI